jgi:hypothetical protein
MTALAQRDYLMISLRYAIPSPDLRMGLFLLRIDRLVSAVGSFLWISFSPSSAFFRGRGRRARLSLLDCATIVPTGEGAASATILAIKPAFFLTSLASFM